MFTHFTHFLCWSSHKSLQEFVKYTSSSATSKGNTKMASSSIFSAPFLGFTQTKPKPNPIASWVCSSMASSHKSSLGSSKSAFFQHGFSLKSPIFSGFVLKPRSSATVYARAATEKTIYDSTVKVKSNSTQIDVLKAILTLCDMVVFSEMKKDPRF